MAPAIPDRWIPYKACGNVIEGTRLICFKVPLRKNVQTGNPDIKEIWDIPALLNAIPKLGAVIDLTNTHRYYNPKELQAAGILHKKILMPGRIIPPKKIVEEFMTTVDEFLGKDDESLIGVHCTHGLNRTGYMVCQYMRDRLNVPGEDAITRFEKARGYEIERENYRAHILGEKPPPPDLGQHTVLKSIHEHGVEKLDFQCNNGMNNGFNYNKEYRNRNCVNGASTAAYARSPLANEEHNAVMKSIDDDHGVEQFDYKWNSRFGNGYNHNGEYSNRNWRASHGTAAYTRSPLVNEEYIEARDDRYNNRYGNGYINRSLNNRDHFDNRSRRTNWRESCSSNNDRSEEANHSYNRRDEAGHWNNRINETNWRDRESNWEHNDSSWNRRDKSRLRGRNSESYDYTYDY